jgi:hypothetical protein
MEKRNEYVSELGRFYRHTPKAVFAAIAFSFANRLFAKTIGTEVEDVLRAEWKTLHENGIVPQKPKGA